MRKGTLILVLSLAASDALGQEGKPVQAPCSAVTVTNAVTRGLRQLPALPALQVLDAELAVDLPAGLVDLSKPTPIELRFFTPSRSLYQSLTVVVASAEGKSASGETKVVQGFPQPLPVQTAASDADGRATVQARLPVAGTHIVRSSLYGTWNVRVFEGSREISCPGGTSFQITP